MVDKNNDLPELESPEKILHDIITPLLISKMNAELLAEYLPHLLASLRNSTNTSNLLPEDEKIVTALMRAPDVINSNLAFVQKKYRQLSDSFAQNHDEIAQLANQNLLHNGATTNISYTVKSRIKNILLVEDEAIHQDIGINLLSPEYTVESARNGVEAINKCKQKTYDLILMDLQMPKMDGEKATSALRKFIHSDTIIIGLTSMPTGGKRAELLALGFNDFLEKPLKLESFQKLLSSHST